MVSGKARHWLVLVGCLIVASLFLCLGTVQAQSVLRLRFGHVQPASHPTNRAAEWMAEQLKTRSGGRLEMTVYPAGALGGDNELFEALTLGILDFAWISTGSLARQVPELGLFSVSYLIDGFDHYMRVVERSSPTMAWMADIIKKREPSVRLVGMMGGSPRRLYNRVRSIQEPADLAGLRIRIQESPIEAKVWSTLGARPVPLAWSEIYTALQLGAIDGAESSTSSYVANKFEEVTRFHSLTEHQYMFLPVLMSERSFARIPEDLKDMVLEVAWEAGLRSIEIFQNEENQLLVELEAKGIVIDRPNLRPFVELVAPIQEEVARDLGATELLKLVRAAAEGI